MLGLLLLTGALAGCMGGDDESTESPSTGLEEASANETETNETEPEDTGPELTRTWHNGTIDGGSLPTGGYYCSPGGPCDNTMEFEVPQGTETIHVEAAWEQDASAWFNVSGPECESAFVVFEFCSPSKNTDGDSPLSIRFDSARTNTTGTWVADIWVDETTPTAIEPTIVATVVTDGELPSDYTALDGSSGSP